MEDRVKKLLDDEVCELILEQPMTSEQRYELLFYLLYETEEDILSAMKEMIRDDFPVVKKNDDDLYYVRKMVVEIIIVTYGIHYDNLNLKKLLAL